MGLSHCYSRRKLATLLSGFYIQNLRTAYAKQHTLLGHHFIKVIGISAESLYCGLFQWRGQCSGEKSKHRLNRQNMLIV